MSRFSHVSLLIELDCELWWPNPDAFVETASYFPRRARTLVHESIHFWQQLAHGYMLALAEEDWRQLRAWEQGGRAELGPVREQFRRPEGKHRFSAHDLCESMARFWEVLFVGPEMVLRDAVTEARRKSLTGEAPKDLEKLASQAHTDSRTVAEAMDLSGSYGAPFAVVCELTADRDALAIFPFLVHFALETPHPVCFFERFLDEVAPAAVQKAEALGIATAWDQKLATKLYLFVSERCEAIVRRESDAGLLRASVAFADSVLRDNAAYVWAFARMENLAAMVNGMGTLDMAVCLPAFQDFRTLLAFALTPPCARFRDRQTLALAERYAAHRDAPAEEVAAAASVVPACLSLQERWASFQTALRAH